MLITLFFGTPCRNCHSDHPKLSRFYIVEALHLNEVKTRLEAPLILIFLLTLNGLQDQNPTFKLLGKGVRFQT